MGRAVAALICAAAGDTGMGAAAGGFGGGACEGNKSNQSFQQAFDSCLRERGHTVLQ